MLYQNLISILLSVVPLLLSLTQCHPSEPKKSIRLGIFVCFVLCVCVCFCFFVFSRLDELLLSALSTALPKFFHWLVCLCVNQRRGSWKQKKVPPSQLVGGKASATGAL